MATGLKLKEELQPQDFIIHTKNRNIGRKDPIMSEIKYDPCQLAIKISWKFDENLLKTKGGLAASRFDLIYKEP